jgi:hypothetical protein
MYRNVTTPWGEDAVTLLRPLSLFGDAVPVVFVGSFSF